MKYALLMMLATFFLFNFSGCEKAANADSACNNISLNKTFTARVNEMWCLNQDEWSIRFGPVVEDSRCNVTGIDCVWAGRFVMAATIIDHDGQIQDTFYAVHNWTDTLHQGIYKIILSKVNPEIRTSMDQLDPSKYSVDITVSEE